MSASNTRVVHSERGKAYRRILDRLFGIPIVFALGAFRQKRQKPQSITSIGILINVAIGDTTIASGIVRDIQRDLPSASITLFVGSSNYEVAMLIEGANVVKLPVLNIIKSVRILNDYQFDAWLDLGQWARLNAICSFFVNAKFKVGFRTNGQFRHYAYDACATHSSERHEIENFRAITKLIGVNGMSLPNFQSGEQKQNFAILHPFAGGSRAYLKEWSSDNWRTLISELSKNYDAIYLSGTSADELKINELIKDLPKAYSLAGKTTIKELVEMLNKASLVVSVDTGIMHLASAVDANLIALHGPTAPKGWGALNSNAISLTPKNLKCHPCLSLGFESSCQNPICMKSITADDVLKVIN